MIMEVKYCARCKKLFQYIGGPMLCPSCRDEEEKDFQRVKEFLRENPKATITEISESLTYLLKE
jgi:predicted amidophosphoribosyltransferase